MTRSGLKENSIVLFIGDSITDAGRSYLSLSSLGINHPKLFDEYIKDYFKTDNITVYNMGVAGDTLLSMYFRLEEDCYAFNPDYIVLLIGVNDSWNNYSGGDSFEKSYRHIINSILSNTNAKIILIEPFLLEATPEMQVNCVIPNINNYISYVLEMDEIIRCLAAEYNLDIIYLAEIFRQLINSGTTPTQLASDAIHPTAEAVSILLDQILYKLGVKEYTLKTSPFDVSSLDAQYLSYITALHEDKDLLSFFPPPDENKGYCAIGIVNENSKTAKILLENGEVVIAHYDQDPPITGFVNAYRRQGDEYVFEEIRKFTPSNECFEKWNITVNVRQKQLLCGSMFYVNKSSTFFIKYGKTEWRVFRGRGSLPCENYNIDLALTTGFIVYEDILDELAKVARCIVIVGSCDSTGEWLPSNDETTKVFDANHIGFTRGDKDLS